MRKEIYDYIHDHSLANTTNLETLTSTLQGVTVSQHVSKKIINNHIATRGLNSKMRMVTLAPHDPDGVDKPIPAAGGVTVRLAAFAGLDFFLADTGDEVNPDNAQTKGLISILQGAEVFSADEVSDFWALFTKPLFPELQVDENADEATQQAQELAAQAIVRAALNTPDIETLEGIIQAAETLNSDLTNQEATRQSARMNDLAALRAALSEFQAGEDAVMPEMPSSEAWA